MRTCPNCGERHPDRARFCMMCATPLATGAIAEETRKVVTVLFADVKGSTAIGERLDPEAVRRVLTRFYASARETLERNGGTVEKFIGDAVMAVFGVPRVREDDAPRGVRAAWELLDVMRAMNADLSERYGAELQLRIGVNTGEVVAGDPGTGSSFVAGDAVNVAARLEQTAPPGEVYLGADTYALARDGIDAEPVEPLTLKGKSERVPAFHLLGLRAEPGIATESPFVGRDEELRGLVERLDEVASSGVAGHVLLTGPAGIGKTRLMDELLRGAVGRARGIRARCTPAGDRDRLAPIHDLVRSALGVGVDAPDEDVREVVASVLGASERAPVLADALLRTLGHEDGAASEESAWAVAEILRAVAPRDPAVVVVDDTHWADAGLRALLDGLAERTDGAPLLWIEAYRDDVGDEATSPPPADAERTALRPLEPEAADRLLELSTSIPLEAALRQRILEAAGGNPLFLVEMARLAADGGSVVVPPNVHALLAARVDTLPDDERRALEVAAVLGRTVELDALDDLLGTEGRPPVDRLQRQGFLEQAGPGSLAFPHGSMREVAYGGATKQRRAELHETVADRCERIEAPAEVLGHHLERSVELLAELGAPDEHDRALAGRGALALAAAGIDALGAGDRAAGSAYLVRARSLALVTRTDEPRIAAGRLAVRLGSWDEAIELLTPAAGDPATWNPLGVALTKRRLDGDLDRGRELLERAAAAGDVDAAAALAGTWKGADDRRALDLYRTALELDPSDPYALGNVLGYEIEQAGDLSPFDERRPALVAATERRRAQAVAGADRPWSWYDLGTFELLLGRAEMSLTAYAAAVHSSGAAFMPQTTLNSLERMGTAIRDSDAFRWARTLLRLALASVFRGSEEPEVAGEGGLAEPVWILAGGSGTEIARRIATYRVALLQALEGSQGTLISGGTAQGVSALAGDLAEAVPGIRTIGYLPRTVPAGVALDPRYAETRRTDGATFTILEALRYWCDVVASDIDPARVRLLGIGGGEISSLEYRLALALGATVGIVAESGAAATDLLRDATWAVSDRLVEVAPTREGLRGFLMGRQASHS